MNQHDSNICEQLAQAASRFQHLRTGHAPSAVTVVLGEDTMVFTLHDALTPAEKTLAASPSGAARVQEFHRQLFASSTGELRQEIGRITGRQVREAAAEIETATGAVIHVFTSGAMVQVFLFGPHGLSDAEADRESLQRAADDGLRTDPSAGLSE
jgi:uncharacterized protein YbcI